MCSVPELASQLVEKMSSQAGDENKRTLIFVGSKSVGKSTLIYSFLDKNDTPRETLVLEYLFGRKSNQRQDLEKNVCHVWEYGGMLELFKNVVTSIPRRGLCTFVIMLDLSKIKNLWSCLESCLNALAETQVEKNEVQQEIIIVGGKYDLFKNYDSEIKKTICTTLRCVALITNAHLYFYSSKEQSLLRKMKDVLFNFGFNGNFVSKERCSNYAKPLYLPKGSDIWENIGLTQLTLHEVKMKHIARITPDAGDAALLEDHSLDPRRSYVEPVLDALVNTKYEELRNLDDFDLSLQEYLNKLR